MKDLDKLNKRHKEATDRLNKTATPVIEKQGLVYSCSIVASKLEVSMPTVVNYVAGRGRDGFLIESMTEVFKTL